MSRPDRGGLPLNVNAMPFVPGGGGGGSAPIQEEENVWKAQAERLSNVTPPVTYVTPPVSAGIPTPTIGPMTPQMVPKQQATGTPLASSKSTVNCPTGHTMRHCQGNQVVNQDGRLVSVGGVFCRLCDSESLETHTQGYYSCQECHWDCCILCAAGQQAFVPPMSLGHHPQTVESNNNNNNNNNNNDGSHDVIGSIRHNLQLLSDEEPCGLSSMPLDKLKIYEEYLKDKLAKKKPIVQKVSVTKADDEPVSKKKKPTGPKKLKFAVNDRIQFVGGGRFSGNKVCYDFLHCS